MRDLYSHFNQQHRRQFKLVLVLLISSSFFEAASIGALVPFLQVIFSPGIVYNLDFITASALFSSMKIEELRLLLTLAFAITVLLASVLRVILTSYSVRLSMDIANHLSKRIYGSMLSEDYLSYRTRSSADAIALLQKTRDIVYYLIQPASTIISSIAIVISIFAAFLWISPSLISGIFIIFGILYFSSYFLLRRFTTSNSVLISTNQNETVRVVQNSFGSIGDMIISRLRLFYLNLFMFHLQKMQNAGAVNEILRSVPRFVIEGLAITILSFIIFIYSSQPATSSTDLTSLIPILGASVLVVQRVLPLINQCFHGLLTMRSYSASVDDVLMQLNKPVKWAGTVSKSPGLNFHKTIEFNRVSFRYPGSERMVVHDLSFSVERGSHVGIVGPSGVGKSTVMDLLMGLILPTSGEVRVDGRVLEGDAIGDWHRKLALVPQDIFLTNGTIAENIALGLTLPEIDFAQVKFSAILAGLNTEVECLEDGYLTSLGEKGLRFSGGQRQRIALARALYKKPDVLFLDEATSSMDSQLERQVVDAVSDALPGLTIFQISHRPNSLMRCDHLLELPKMTLSKIRNS